MNNRDKTFLQKIKDNAFYLSLGLGLFAILAVVGVYTAQQNDMKVAENEMDLNVASNYTDVSEEEIAETNGEVTKQNKDNVTENPDSLAQDNQTEDENLAYSDKGKEADSAGNANKSDSEDNINATNENQNGDEQEVASNESESDTNDSSASEQSIPTTVDAGQLDFNSEKTITWPVNGEVLIPYSMETTVHFKTLDQYKCNPGMMIQAGVGTTVQNAYLGQVTNVTSDNTYGNMVTLYIGNDYSITYGQLDTIYVKEGDFVKAGQSIGTVGNPTDSFAKEGSHLFFQMSCGEETVDPMLYIE